MFDRAINNPVGKRNDYDAKRYAGVLKLVKEKSKWGETTNGISRGVSAYFCHNSYVAQVVEVVLENNQPKKNEKIVEILHKAIQIQISNQDLAYSLMEVAVISKVKGVTSAKTLDKIPVTGGTYTVTYTGDNTVNDITVEEILTPQVNYDRCGTMTQLNDSLYIGDLHNDLDMLDLQPYANLVYMKWYS